MAGTSGLAGVRATAAFSASRAELCRLASAWSKGPPSEPELIIRIPALSQIERHWRDERAVAGARACRRSRRGSDEDALELRMSPLGAAVASPAQRGCRARRPTPGWSAGQGGVGDRFSLLQVAAVTADLVQCGQSAENHALVVGPRRAAVVRAGRGSPSLTRPLVPIMPLRAATPTRAAPTNVVSPARDTLMQAAPG